MIKKGYLYSNNGDTDINEMIKDGVLDIDRTIEDAIRRVELDDDTNKDNVDLYEISIKKIGTVKIERKFVPIKDKK